MRFLRQTPGFLVVLALLVTLFGCSPPVNVDQELSPRLKLDLVPTYGATAKVFGDGTEQGQRLEIRMEYDAPIVVADGFSMKNLKRNWWGTTELGGDIDCVASVENDTILVLTFTPVPNSQALPVAERFNLGVGALRTSSRFLSGALEHVFKADGSGLNVYLPTVAVTIAPDLEIAAVKNVMGSKTEGVCASGSFKIAHVPSLRLDASINLTLNAQVRVSSTNFTDWDNSDAGRALYAAHVADSINTQIGDQFEAWSEGDTVYLKAWDPHEGELIEPMLVFKNP
jgi:hypothetical protein